MARSITRRSNFIHRLTEGRTYKTNEIAAMELAVSRNALALRQELLRGALTLPQVESLLGEPLNQINMSRLLAVESEGNLYFPVWQFDSNRFDGIIPGLSEVLDALNISPLAKARWMMLSNPYLERRTPLQALKEGDVVRVVDQACAVGVV